MLLLFLLSFYDWEVDSEDSEDLKNLQGSLICMNSPYLKNLTSSNGIVYVRSKFRSILAVEE
jgi:hypothetical protein